MKRRTCITTCLAGAVAAVALGKPSAHPIQLQVDLSVDPAREQEMLRIFHSEFRPAASRQPGFRDLQILKLRSTLAGSAPAGANYRFVLTFDSEDLRKKWVATEVHQKLWPKMEQTLRSKDYTVLLYDTA
jgi:heme-degrading monooxygenase HmoA